MTSIAWGHRHHSLLMSATAAIALGFALAIGPTLALAEAQISGKPDVVSLKAYPGSLQQVVKRVLTGYDFFVKSGEKELGITSLGSGQTTAFLGSSSESEVAVQRADATTERSPASPAKRPVMLAEGPRPIAAAPSPVPGPSLSSAPLPSAPIMGSTPPAPVRGAFRLLPPVAGPTSAPRSPR
jgi:hypothetical protein